MFRISNLCSAVFVLWHFLIALRERESIDYLTPFGVYVQTTRYNVSIYFQQTNDRVLLPFNKRMLYKFDGPLFFLVACLLLLLLRGACLISFAPVSHRIVPRKKYKCCNRLLKYGLALTLLWLYVLVRLLAYLLARCSLALLTHSLVRSFKQTFVRSFVCLVVRSFVVGSLTFSLALTLLQLHTAHKLTGCSLLRQYDTLNEMNKNVIAVWALSSLCTNNIACSKLREVLRVEKRRTWNVWRKKSKWVSE